MWQEKRAELGWGEKRLIQKTGLSFLVLILFFASTICASVTVYDVKSQRSYQIPEVLSGQLVHITQSQASQRYRLSSVNASFETYNYLSFRVTADAVLAQVKSRLVLSDAQGVEWTQKGYQLGKGTFYVPLDASFWESTSGKPFLASAIAWIGVQIDHQAFSSSFTFDLDDLTVFDQKQLVSSPPPLPQGVALTVLTADSQAPSITDLKTDDQALYAEKFIRSKPQISVSMLDTVSGVSTWSIQVLSAQSSTVVTQHSGNAQGIKTPFVATFNVSSELPDGRYVIKVTASDGVNVTTNVSPAVVVKSELDLGQVLNNPNPFNPNIESTNVDYQLSKDAEVNFYIYSQSGELQERYHFDSGSLGGIAGYNRLVWDGKNRFGEKVANGIYIGYMVVSADGKTKKGKVKIWVRK